MPGTSKSVMRMYWMALVCVMSAPAAGRPPTLMAKLFVDSSAPLRLTVEVTNVSNKRVTLYHADDHLHRWRFAFGDASTYCLKPIPVDHEPKNITLKRGRSARRTFTCDRFSRNTGPRRELPPGTYRASVQYEYNGDDDRVFHGTFYAKGVPLTIAPPDLDVSAPANLSAVTSSSKQGGIETALVKARVAHKYVAQGRELRPEEPQPVRTLMSATLDITATPETAVRDWALFVEDASGTLIEAVDCSAHADDGESWFGDLALGTTRIVVTPSRFQTFTLTRGDVHHVVVRLRTDENVHWLRSDPITLELIPPTPEESKVP